MTHEVHHFKSPVGFSTKRRFFLKWLVLGSYQIIKKQPKGAVPPILLVLSGESPSISE